MCRKLIKAIDAYLAKADEDLADTLDSEGYTHGKDTVNLISDIEDEVAEALEVQTAIVVTGATAAASLSAFKSVWRNIQQSDTLDREIEDIFRKNLEKFLPKYTEYYIKRTDRALVCTRLTKRSQAWIEEWSRDLGEIMKLNSHREIQTILDAGIKDGIGTEEFTRRIFESGIRNERYKARRVALTEVLTAHRMAQQEAFEQSPSVKDKEWQHTGAHKNEPRQNHVDMNGQTVSVNSPFELEGEDGEIYYPMIPGDTNLPPEERINCHCIAKPIVDEDILGMPL